MGVDGGVTGGACKVLVLAVGDVEMGFWIAVFLGEAKVDNVDLVASFANAHKEVVGFDVSMDEGLCMDIFNTRDLHVNDRDNKGEYKLVSKK